MPRCPSCFVIMKRTEEGNIRYLTCDECFGSWIAESAFFRLVRGYKPKPKLPDQPDTEPPIEALAEMVLTSNTSKTMKCLDCKLEMKKEKIHPMIPVWMDRCPKCRSVWLDVGEKSLICRLWYELQSSTDPRIIEKRERLALAASEWTGRTTMADEVASSFGNTNDADITTFTLYRIFGIG